MKKAVILILAAAFFSGCSSENISSTAETEMPTESVTEMLTEAETEPETEPETAPPPVEISSGISLIDLSVPANSDYLQYRRSDTMLGESFDAAGWGTITSDDVGLWLEDGSGEKTLLIDTSEDAYHWVEFSFMIDESRFCYTHHSEWGVYASVIYDLSTGEDFVISKDDDGFAYVPEFASETGIMFSRVKFGEFGGFSEMDIDTYQLRNLDYSPTENARMMSDTAFSSDKKTAAFLASRKTEGEEYEYIISLYSLDEEKTVREISISSKHFANESISFLSGNRIGLFAFIIEKIGDSSEPYCYIIDIDKL